MKFVVATIAVWSALFGFIPTTWATEIQLRLTDGRRLQGTLIDAQTDRSQLALELRREGVAIRRMVAWKEVELDSVRVLPEAVAKKKRREQVPLANDRLSQSLSDDELAAELPLADLRLVAEPISTFGKMDWDSLRLSLQGFDQLGIPVPLFGTLQVTLWGLREELDAPQRVNTPFGYIDSAVSRRLAVQKIYSWTRGIDSTVQRLPGTAVPVGGRQGRGGVLYEDVTAHPWGASGYGSQSVAGFAGRQDRGRPVYAQDPSDVLKMILPLPRPLPDFDVQRYPLGEVSVELLMPGVGVFSAASPGVVLVHQSPLRQELLNQSGSRFFPNEVTTDGRGLWREPRQPSQIRLITPAPFPTQIVP